MDVTLLESTSLIDGYYNFVGRIFTKILVNTRENFVCFLSFRVFSLSSIQNFGFIFNVLTFAL